jgi:D-inositol-3-phosphate glycosyltransferase
LDRFRPIAPDDAKHRIGMPLDQTTIVFAGRIEPLKGIDTLLEAVTLIRNRHPQLMQNTSVTIIGGDPWADDLDAEMARLQEMRGELGLHDLVTFAGAKDQNVLPCYYAAAAMVVVPSHYESFGMVALEAMAMGTPVIASEVGGLAYLVQNGRTGFHIPVHDPEALAARMYELLVNETCRQQLGRQARAYSRQFDWKRIVQRMMNLYAEIVPVRNQ